MNRILQAAVQFCYGDLYCRLLPVKKNRILFSSFYGQHYSDGPRAISEHLHEQDPDMEIWWAFREPEEHRLPAYVRAVSMDSPRYFRIKATAKFLVTNVYQQGGYLSGSRLRDSLIRLHLRLENRKKQSVLTTWHGTPLKRMGNDAVGAKQQRFACNQPCYYLVGNAFEESVMLRLTQNKLTPLRFGSPRSFRPSAAAQARAAADRQALGIGPEDGVVLYAPTFRSAPDGRKLPEASGLSQLQALDFARLERCLCDRFGWKKLVLICRFHNLVERSVDWKRLQGVGTILPGNEREDIQDYYPMADMVITDYSSVMFDFMNSGRPVFLLCPDYTSYSGQERGLYFAPEELPFPMSEHWEALEAQVKAFDEAAYRHRLRRFRERLGSYGDEAVLEKTAAFLRGEAVDF